MQRRILRARVAVRTFCLPRDDANDTFGRDGNFTFSGGLASEPHHCVLPRAHSYKHWY